MLISAGQRATPQLLFALAKIDILRSPELA